MSTAKASREFLGRDPSIMSQKYLGIILCTTQPPAGRRSLKAAISLQGLPEGSWGSVSK
jgi:hypothetical protein